MRMTHAAFLDCQGIVTDNTASDIEVEAAEIAIDSYRLGKCLADHVALVLFKYTGRQQQQNRWGR